MTHLALSFLGGFEVTRDTEPVSAFGADKVRALLAFLAIEAFRPHRRSELSAMFWPDATEKKAAHSLSQSLLRLRQALQETKATDGAPFLLLTQQDVQFNGFSDYRLDVTRFRELLNQSDRHVHSAAAGCEVCHQWLQQAADLYRGDLLAGLFVSNSVAFEEWRLVLQEEMHRRALDCLGRLTAYYELRGDFEQVQKYARRQIALEPWREQAHLQLMSALAYSGQNAAALMQYEHYRRTLAEELGLNPSAQMTQLYEQIRLGALAPKFDTPSGAADAIWLSGLGERRQVTTLVCSRSSQADPEDLPASSSWCERHCQGIITRFGGRRALRQGNACLVYFGYPQSYEDAARRAVHSGLALAAAQKSDGPAYIGIHTGIMLVGEGRDSRWQDRDLGGAALELARDCQRLAGPGQVLITEDTRRLVQDAFELRALAATLPGAGGQALYQVQAESGLQSRLDWLAQTQRLTVFTGREAELRQIEACYQKPLQGKGQAVFLSGEPGIGKSRLIWELKKRITEPWFVVRCLPHYQNTSLYPIVGLMEQLLGFQSADSPAARQEKLIGTLAWYGLNRPSVVWLLSLLLGLPTETPVPETITTAQREQMRQTCVTLLQKRAAEQTLVLVVEDLHWSDPSTLEWISQSLTSLAATPCLMLLTARPGFNPAWLSSSQPGPDLLRLLLEPLPDEQAEQMVTDLLGDSYFQPDLCRQIIAQTDGVPLFIEELTKTLLERPTSGGGAEIPANLAAGASAGIPATLLDSLAARLDFLGPAKETAQWAAALGREFYLAVLQACVPYDEQRLQSDLARLIEAELIAPVQAAPQDVAPYLAPAQPGKRLLGLAPLRYAFRHALMQEATYTSLLKRTRQAHHRRIADALEAHFPQVAQTRPEVLAQHYFSAGLPNRAVDFWLQAGESALAQGALLEARIFFDRAIAHIEPQDGERRWRALCGREAVFDFCGEREAQSADLAALLELADAFNDDTRRAQAYLKQTAAAGTQGDFQATLPLAEAARSAARGADNLNLELKALAFQAQTLTFFREMEAARQAIEAGLAQVDQADDDAVRALVLTVAACYYLESGDPVRSVQLQTQSVEPARRSGNGTLEVTILANLGLLYAMLGLYSQARATLEAGLARADALGDRRVHAGTLRHLGYVFWCHGEHTPAYAMVTQALDELSAIGDIYGEAACHAYLGYMLQAAGDPAQALEHLAPARTGFGAIGMDADKVEAQAVEAHALLALGRRDDAQRLALEAWDYLSEQGAEGLGAPCLAYLCLADVVQAVDAPGTTYRQIIAAGHRDLLQRAENISDETWRHTFLAVPENRAMIERAGNL